MMFLEPYAQETQIDKLLEDHYRICEKTWINKHLDDAMLSLSQRTQIQDRARAFIMTLRQNGHERFSLEGFLNEYPLSSKQGLALMCLAEAFLRTPDRYTLDQLIQDKLSVFDETSHEVQSQSLLMHWMSWALIITGKMLQFKEARYLFKGMIRTSIDTAMHRLSEQFVMGKTIESALKHSKKREKQGYRYSYDMLGEAALTDQDSAVYFKAYEDAIIAIGRQVIAGRLVHENPGISIKLSALHPRYQEAQRTLVFQELMPKVLMLAQLAKSYNIGCTIDAEESERLMLSLDVLAALLSDPSLSGWDGLGLAVQAYQKRAWYVLDWVAYWAKKTNHRIMVRLVKGAYWDSEIKKTQMQGLSDYPVFTHKVFTDVSYQACVKKMFSMGDLIYPQFATHNAYTVAMVLALATPGQPYEFQCLQGMGQSLYDQIVSLKEGIVCRVYAPVGRHETLLPYLVRRLLENGANSSFVHRMADPQVSVEALITDPTEAVISYLNRKGQIPLPADIFLPRINSKGIDWSSRRVLREYSYQFEQRSKQWHAKPLLHQYNNPFMKQARTVYSPFDIHYAIGTVIEAHPIEVEYALESAQQGFFEWSKVSVHLRAEKIRAFSMLLEHHHVELMHLACLEAGKTWPDALAEVREAVDFCRYYADQAELWMGQAQELKGYTGEKNTLSLVPRGIIVCISPWNFPLAIFIGQLIAALVTGNVVLAKPAEQTPLIATFTVQLLWSAGIPSNAIQLLPGRGEEIGELLVSDVRVQGVMFTGSTQIARHIATLLAHRSGPLTPLIAETGGQNAMIVDSSALLEQATVDILSSAFGSAGQRCSALRVLFIQQEIYPSLIALLKGAMQRLSIGDPRFLSTDIGPVIDKAAYDRLQSHIDSMRQREAILFECPITDPSSGYYIAPTLIEIKSLSVLTEEQFGPVLHVVSYAADELEQVLDQINDTGYGLTLGIHTRIEAVAAYIQSRVHVGNCYVNRNMIGAIVGLQPFGGEGLSGTGPKAGGPHYLLRLCHERTLTIDTTAAGGNASLLNGER